MYFVLLTPFIKNLNFLKKKENILLSFGLGVIGVISNLLSLRGLELVNNPGYHRAVLSTSILITTFLSILLLKSTVELAKILGAILIMLGIILISIP